MTFFDSYSYRYKNYALIVLGLLLLAVAYKRSFRGTLEARDYRTELKEKIAVSRNSSREIRQTNARLAVLNEFLGKENSSIEKVQQGFLTFFTRNAQKIVVFEVSEVQSFQHPDFTIYTHKVILKGDFIHTLKFLNRLETQFDLARLINVSHSYEKVNDSDPALYTTILFQNYVRNNTSVL